MRCPNALHDLEEEVSDVFAITTIQDGLLQTASPELAVLLLIAAHQYVTNSNELKEDISARAFYRAALQNVRVLHVLCLLITDANPGEFRYSGFGIFLAVKVPPHTRTTITSFLDTFTNAMKLFRMLFVEKRGL